MPRPPPPAVALRMTGKPISLGGLEQRVVGRASTPVPGSSGTPAAHRFARADLVAHQAHRLAAAGR